MVSRPSVRSVPPAARLSGTPAGQPRSGGSYVCGDGRAYLMLRSYRPPLRSFCNSAAASGGGPMVLNRAFCSSVRLE